MTDFFKDAKLRLSNAKRHFADFDRSVDAFFDRDPYTEVMERDPDGFYDVLKIKLTEPLPEEWTLHTVDAIDNMRSSLDLAACACALAAGVTNPKSAYFPFADSEIELENVIKRRCKDIPPAIISYFRTLKPYQGGNDAIWAMNKIRNSNNHRLLVATGKAVSTVHIDSVSIVKGGLNFHPQWDSAKNEMILARTRRGGAISYKGAIAFHVVFNEVEFLAGEEVRTVLNHLCGMIDSIIDGTEAEARRIGLIS